MLKAEAWRDARDAPTWRADAIDFRRQARDAFAPSMQQRIDVAGLYADALASLPETMDGAPPLPIQSEVPTLEELFGEGVRLSVTKWRIGPKGPWPGLESRVSEGRPTDTIADASIESKVQAYAWEDRDGISRGR